MLQDTATILETCLEEVAAGKATVQECLDRRPDLAGELEPLLRAAEGAQAIDRPSLAPEARARIEARLLAAAESIPHVQPARSSRPTIPRVWRWAAIGLVLLFTCACLLGAGLVTAASDALPDSSLYPVKLTTEEVWLRLAPAQDEPALHLRFAQRRLDEAQALAERGQFDAILLAALTEETAAALSGAETLPPEAAEPVLQDVLRVTAEQERVLSALVANASALERDEFARTLQASGAHRACALQLLGMFPPPEEPGRATPAFGPTPTIAEESGTPTETPQPTATATLATTPEPTGMSQPTKSPEPTGVPAATPRASATVEPTGTVRPAETVEPTETVAPSTATVTPGSQGCVYGLGYWRNHPDAWPVDSLALGNETYTQAELLDLLNRPTRGDASLILVQQLIAAHLNVANGADDSTIAATIAAADTWLAKNLLRMLVELS
jgi:hypothetical protein